ncbi:hypothetical protein [Erythrobacter donghaensis]|uniref:hypothetical protein n=1 Tax=Erythrobacter donghaensis TaxID=267135 RepID=UPI000A36E29B|nr:hypothetical protein [Erythrobacter donghaensis]
MSKLRLAAAILLGLGMATSASAQEQQLDGLTSDEAASIIASLEKSQEALRSGEFQPFTLLSGSVASYGQADISPRQIFVDLPFRDAWKVVRVETNTKTRQPYRLSYAPEGLGRRYWDIEAVFGANGELEMVTMTYKVPAPF